VGHGLQNVVRVPVNEMLELVEDNQLNLALTDKLDQTQRLGDCRATYGHRVAESDEQARDQAFGCRRYRNGGRQDWYGDSSLGLATWKLFAINLAQCRLTRARLPGDQQAFRLGGDF